MSRSKEKKSVKIRILSLGIVLLGVLCLIYGGLCAFYGSRFSYGSYINDHYVTGMTVSEVNEMLIQDTIEDSFTLLDLQGNVTTIQKVDLGCKTDYSQVLNVLLSEQNPFAWWRKLIVGENVLVMPEYSIDETVYGNASALFPSVREGKNVKKASVSIQKSAEEGYILLEDTEDVPNADSILSAVKEQLLSGEDSFIASEKFYDKRFLDANEQEKVKLFKEIEELQNMDITYDMGTEQVHVDAAVISDFITDANGKIHFDEEGHVAIREDAVEEFVNALADAYDTYKKPRSFVTTNDDTIVIENNYMGTLLDRKAEIAYLSKAVSDKLTETHVPKYLHETKVHGLNDLGDTYVEIDKDNQRMYLYVDGEMIVDTPVVTGCVATGHQTPSMVNPIVSKETERWLTGPGYASYVHYFMHIRNGIGIHDASWRNEFGEEIYKTAGSHGCINTPDDAVKTIFENIEIGTPAIIY